ncbi:DUF1793-domain-containing protein [Schizopora paradoxa]|uniref:DUF1793-domain-containing protein n=1 Tax=Schizopora paradoxa TaxID=27342 RepID=A0A0H2RW77_9AGAM|nr:DUF1793-domain-containing protein [Schizopora paradoxa]
MHLNRSLTKVFLALSSIVVGAVAQSSGQWTTSPFNPPAIPLAVKSPYLNSWLPQGKNASAANEAWATFWNEAGFDDLINTLYAGANVDGVSYRLLGNAEVPNVITAQQLAVVITATRTSFLFKAGAMEINATFLSPIDLNNLTTMSRPTTYLYMTASSTDGKSHEVALYSDVSSRNFIEWGAVPDLADATVGFANDTGFLHLFTAAAQPARYSEINQQSPSATVYLSMQEIEGMTFEVGLDSNVRANFAVNSSLASAAFTQGGEFIDPSLLNSTSGLPTLGMAVDLGDLRESGIVVWTLTLMETSNIQFASVDGIQHRYPYYLSESLSVPNTSANIAGDFDNILLNSISIDNAVRADGLAVSQEYADILALSLRQVMASMEITISVGSDGQWNTSDVMSFMKNMGNLGSSVGINCVDILYSAFPAFMYLNSAFGRYLLEPLFNYQDSPAYTLPYAAQDIGTVYPNATGNPNPHMFGIEESANMIIMTYADILASGDGGLASQHYTLLKSWGSYLLNNSLLPGESYTKRLAPEFAEDNLTNMTNLALKGIIGLGAMAQISDFLGFVEDGSDFRGNAEAMIAKWQQMAVIDDQVFLSYNAQNVTGLLYNLYADKMLELGLVPQSVRIF